MAFTTDDLFELTQNDVDSGYWLGKLENDTDYTEKPVDKRFTVYDDTDDGVSIVYDDRMDTFGSVSYDPGDVDQRDAMLMHMISWVPWFGFENEDVTTVAVYRQDEWSLFDLLDVLEDDEDFVQHRDYPRGYQHKEYELLLHGGKVSVAATADAGPLGPVQDILDENFTYEKFVLRDGESWISRDV